MNVLSLFDGMSCGRIALERAGVNVNRYYASEIDKYAIKVSNVNYPDIIQLGDITNIRCSKQKITNGVSSFASNIDLVIGGSPCQGFSFAGKGLNFDDPRSALFFEYVRLLEEIKSYNNDVKFLLENVVMKKEYQDVISKILGVEPVMINSDLVSAQNRKRLYWTNIEFDIPEDKNIFWRDIQIDNAENCMYYSDAAFNWIFKSPKRKEKYFEYTKYSNIKMQMLEKSHSKGYSNQRCFGIVDNGKTRYIHPIECERMQNVPDNYTSCVSNSQRYMMLGNGWTVNLIASIFKGLR